jgi:hypothetical protein
MNLTEVQEYACFKKFKRKIEGKNIGISGKNL